ncbi:MAG: cell division protein FtsZ [Tidjanibacter sp.]|nr:cell division protein FtsZ [Tidjanibacter sp.]
MSNIANNGFLGSIMAPAKSRTDILVMGVGGAGGNAVNHMYDLGIKDVTFVVCNTDRQALQNSPIENKIQLGSGHGAGNDPDKGKNLALESLDDIMIELENSKARMIFITAGMGGGTGTGAAPIIAKAAKSKGLLTVGVVTLPFRAEGPTRVGQAQKGLEELRANTDSIVVIHNDNISKIHGSLPVIEAFHKADDILATAVKGIAEMITRTDFINVDLEDVRTTMKDKGLAVMGSARTTGENKIDKAVDEALSSPLLNQQDIRGAKKILFNLSFAEDRSLTFEEATRVQTLIQSKASLSAGGMEADIIWGAGPSGTLTDDEIELTVIATGFEPMARKEFTPIEENNKLRIPEEEDDSSVKWDIPDRYKDIDNMLIQPAYFRRGLQLIGSTKATRTQSSETLAEAISAGDATPQAEERTLF